MLSLAQPIVKFVWHVYSPRCK